jgi:hypothetical protein
MEGKPGNLFHNKAQKTKYYIGKIYVHEHDSEKHDNDNSRQAAEYFKYFFHEENEYKWFKRYIARNPKLLGGEKSEDILWTPPVGRNDTGANMAEPFSIACILVNGA